MKTIKPLILLAALFSFTAGGVYAQENGPGNGQQRQKQIRQGLCDGKNCDQDCNADNCRKAKLRNGKNKGKGQGEGQGRSKGKGRGQGAGNGNGRGGRN